MLGQAFFRGRAASAHAPSLRLSGPRSLVPVVPMSSPADQVSLPEVKVNLPAQEELKFKTALFCVHCGLYWPEETAKKLSCASKVGCLCVHSASSCKFVRHNTCASSVGKGYCFDLEKDWKGQDGWFYNQGQGKGCLCMETEQQAKCAKSPFVLLKGARQLFCCDVRCAIPFDDEVPMQLAIAGKVLYAPGQAKM